MDWLGKDLYRAYSHEIKVNGELKALAEQIVTGAASDDQKLDRLLLYCRTELKDTGHDEISAANQDGAKINNNSLDTIRHKQGTATDITYAFVALAQALGFDARRAELSDRATFLFGPVMQSRYFLNAVDAVVNVGGKWLFYDVTNPAVPGGQLRWQEQGVYALIEDDKHPEMVLTPMLAAAQNMKRRIAVLSLSEDGTLEGDVRVMRFGSYASEWREHNRDTNDAQREQELRNELKERFADFSLTNAGFHAPADAANPVGITYHIVIPHYAQRTGKRLFVQPDYFAAGYGSVFTESTRHNHIYFEFPWSEADTVQVKLPAGFELDHADAPGAIHVRPSCDYTVTITLDKTNRLLDYERRATRPLPAYTGRVPAAVLFNEQKVTVDSLGMMDIISRHAVKILTHEGKGEANVVESYEKGGRQIKELRAWLIAPGGFVKTFDKGSVEDLGAYSDDLYNDFRLRRIKADNPEIGSVFVYESKIEEKATEAQDRFAFQDNLPSLESRYTITVPAGWTISGNVLNHEPVQPIIDGNSATWVLKGLPFREREDFAPRLYGTAALLAVDFQPPAGVADPPSFKTWSDVSQWHTGIAEQQADLDADMEAKVRELTAGSSSEYDKIRAIGRFVQNIRYVEIAMDLSRNGGVRPHLASQVFAKRYGDCKDKANLMRALLKTAGIQSYLVAIYSGDRTFVKKEWPSPSQFNHMILAVQISDQTKAPTVMDSPAGRVLLFDPTDDKTPMGDLPWYEQVSYALLCDGAHGGLVQMPILPPESNLLSQTVDASLDAQGGLNGSVATESTGQAARRERGLYENGSPERYKSAMERYLTYYVKGASVSKVDARDLFDQGRFSDTLNFASDHYGQLMQNQMLVFNAGVVEPAAIQFPSVKERLEPLILNGKVYHKHVTINLPSGFGLDEMPSPVATEAPFAKFSVTYSQNPGQLIMDEELRTETVTLPATDYTTVKKFFDDVFGADGRSVVLVKN